MRAPSHVAFGLMWGGVLASIAAGRGVSFGMNGLTAGCAAAVALGTLAPDLDSRTAPLSRALPFLSGPLARRFPHRTATHSLLGLAIASGVVYAVLRLAAAAGAWDSGHAGLVALFFACGYLAHEGLDCTNKAGCPFLWPAIKEGFGYPSHEEDRIVSGDGRWELGITVASLGLLGGLAPVIRQGADTTLANVVGQLPQLQEVYRNAVGREVALRFEGFRAQDRSPVAGQGLILAAQEGSFTVFLQGRVHEVGEDRGDIRLLSGQVRQLERVPEARSMSFRDASIADVLADLVAAGSGRTVLASGELDADRSFAVRKPYAGDVLSVSAKTVRLAFASVADIRGLQVRPAETAGPSAAELARDLARVTRQVDSLVVARQATADLYARDRLFAAITAARKEQVKLERDVRERTQADTVVRFSGQVSVRLVPEL